MSSIAFFSNLDELDILKGRPDFEKIQPIALTPEADFSLISFPDKRKTIEDYYDEKELNILGNASLEKIDEICKSIDREFFKDNPFFSCSDVYMFFKVLYDQLLINHTFCNAILTAETPERIILFNKKDLQPEFIAESYDDLLVSFISYFFRDCHGIPVTVLYSNKVKEKSKTPVLAKAKKFLSKCKFDLTSLFCRIKNRKKNSICIIQHYDFVVAKEIRNEFKVFLLDNKLNFLDLKLDSGKNYNLIESHFVIGEINYFNLIKIKIENLINVIAPSFIDMTNNYSRWMSRKNIKAAIAASGQSLYILAGIKAAKLNKIPVIWGQHGGFYGYSEFPILKYISQHYSHYFMYSEGCFSIKNGDPCFSVSNEKLQSLYYSKRLVTDG